MSIMWIYLPVHFIKDDDIVFCGEVRCGIKRITMTDKQMINEVVMADKQVRQWCPFPDLPERPEWDRFEIHMAPDHVIHHSKS